MGIRNDFLVFFLFCLLAGLGFAQDSPDTAAYSELPTQGSAAGTGSLSDGELSREPTTIYGSPIEGEPSFRLTETENSLLFFQRLTWEAAQYAVRYHLILERKRGDLDTYAEVLRRNVAEPHLDISVPFGEYRYRVMSFNILGLLDSESDWEYFTVLQAFQPTIFEFTPSAFYFDRMTPRIITLTGENLILDAEIYLVHLTLIDEETGEPFILRPIEIRRNELGETARLVFEEEDLTAGEYEIIVINPGGLETKTGFFKIAVAKPYDINVSAGYIPMFTLFGQKEFFLDHFFIPLGFSARVNFVPFKLGFGSFGVELNPFWSLITSEFDLNGSQARSTAHLVVVNVDALFQYWLIRRNLSLNIRAGLGFAGIFDWHFQYINTGGKSKSNNQAAFTYNFGTSIQWLFYKQIYIEGGVDYIHIVHKDIPLGLARLGLFGGYQF